jgi:von Willebrand factor A domain-containing protein 8
VESEVQLLESYAPSINDALLTRLSAAFNELRTLFENGDIAYPYSTREAVAVVKHLQRYPEDDVVAVLHNVFDLDSYDEYQYQKLSEVFRKHSFSFDSYGRWMAELHEAFSDGSLNIEYVSNDGATIPPPLTSPKIGKWDEKNEAHVGGNQWQGGTGGSDTAGLGGRGGPVRALFLFNWL